jgi:hypothetical protein
VELAFRRNLHTPDNKPNTMGCQAEPALLECAYERTEAHDSAERVIAMPFDYRKFDRNTSLGNLVRMKCSREVLRHAAVRYARASALPGERLKSLSEEGITEKQLRAKTSEANGLAGFLRRLQNSPRIGVANDPPKTPIPVWCKELECIAQWIESLQPFRPDKKVAALCLALHVARQTGQRHLPEICKLLNAALVAAGLPPDLTPHLDGALAKQINRANCQKAEAMLRSWEALAASQKPKK